MKRTPRTLHAPVLQRTQNNETVATYAQNFEDAPYTSVTTRRKQREGRHCSRDLRPEFRRCSTRQRHDAPETARGHLRPEFRGRSTRQRTTRGKQRDGRHLRPEFQGRSTRKRHFEDARRASATTREKQREGRHCSRDLRPEFRGRSTRQRHDALETARRSPLAPRISRTLHTPASRCANDRVATYAQNLEDAYGEKCRPMMNDGEE